MNDFSRSCSSQCVRGACPRQDGNAYRSISRQVNNGPPCWHRGNCEVDGPFGIPMLPLVRDLDVPDLMVPFDRVDSIKNRRNYAVDFFVDDRKLQRLFSHPGRFVAKFEGFSAIASPDMSTWQSAPPQFGAVSTWNNRAIGLFFSDRGFQVIPTARWTHPRDYAHCFAGIQPGSVVAVSNNGMWKDPSLREAFVNGLRALYDAIDPAAILLHGHLDKCLELQTPASTRLVHVPTFLTRVKAVA